MFDKHTAWTQGPCYYVVAHQYYQRAWLAGPYQTEREADSVLPRVKHWATKCSLDENAGHYTYRVYKHQNGLMHSILGELSP